ncbi:hypothetical protein D3C84_698380 [compost metagenome]
MGPGHVRLEVHTGEYVVVFPDGAAAVAPGVSGRKPVVFAVATDVVLRPTRQGAGVQRDTLVVRQRARAVARVTAVTRFGAVFQATDVGPANFANQGQSLGAHHLIEEVGKRRLELGHFLAAITLLILTWSTREHGNARVKRSQTGEENVGGVELNRCIRTIAELATPRGTGRQRGRETQAIQTDIFRVFDVVAGVARHLQWQQRRG